MTTLVKHLRSSTTNKRPTASGIANGRLAINTASTTPGLYFANSASGVVKVGPTHVGSTAPNATPAGSSGNSLGESWLDTSGGGYRMKIWDGSAWRSPVITNIDIDTSAAIALSKLATGTLPPGITVTSSNIVDGTIVNADINASAAIGLSKLATGALPSGITIASSNIVDGSIVNADINASAAIAHSKLANITAGQVLLGNASNVPTATALSGDVTVSSSGVTAIAAGVIVNADISAAAAIADTKLATISTAGKVSNSATTATSANTANAIVARDANGDVNVTSINNGPLAGFRNAIINGNFDIWQRGTSFTLNEYGADRWVNVRIGSACTMSRTSWAPGADPSGANARFACRMTVSSVAGASNAVNLTQRIEDVRTFSGQTITVSFWAKADATKPIAIDLAQVFGTGGTPSANVDGIGAQKFTLTTSWAKYTATISVPSIAGKTVGSDGNDYLAFVIWFDAGSSYNSRTNSLGQQSGTFDIAQVQVEPGPVATPFERRPIGTELALCQRYYQIGVYAIPTTGYVPVSQYVVPLRAVPTLAIIATYTGSGGTISDLGGRGVVAGAYATSDHRIAYSASAEL